MHELFWHAGAILQIGLVNLVLSGDNAIVIALAARQLTCLRQRRVAVLWGLGLAIGMRLGLTLLATQLLQITGLRFAGAVLLALIACKLLRDDSDSQAGSVNGHSSLSRVIAQIVVADLVMSLDNVLAVAGIADSNPLHLTLGLILSIAMILACSSALLALLARARWLAYAGTALLACTAAAMMSHDLAAFSWLSQQSNAQLPDWAQWSLKGGLVAACVTSRRWWPQRR